MSKTGPDPESAHCLDVVRRADPDRYLALLYLPPDVRAAAAAVYAFDAEVARIPALVSEPAPGEIRLQWWREVIEGERDSGNHPVAAALLAAMERHGLPHAAFLTLLDARIFDLYQDPIGDRRALETYCGEISSALLQLVAIASGADAGRELADACGHGGVACALAGLVRRAGYHRARQRCHVPDEMLADAGLDRDAWLFEPADRRHLAALGAMISLAREHLQAARGNIGSLDRRLRGVFLPLATVPAYLDVAERAGLKIFETVPDISPLRRHWLFWRAAMRQGPI